ncbi:hypothetical protein SteCoe_7675 [Stentor coeruleus]|uniref:Uncharacterized protein n=1 Tax=Stentor coeruleus TaxID=5963 RepID=A0A1R2CLY7_9CILI|nr:hypothetical protein SteCoe_7675 [Stentor coeruleus]
MLENFELSKKTVKLKEELDKITDCYTKVQKEKLLLEIEYQKELDRWENTTNHLKKIINDLDSEKKHLEAELEKLKKVSEKCNHNDCSVVELKYNLERVSENHKLEQKAAKEQMEKILEELGQMQHEKEEILSEKLIYEEEIKKCKGQIKSLENELKSLKDSLENNKEDIFLWCSERTNRRNLIRNKQKRIYTPQSKLHLKDMVIRKPCNT